VNSALDRTDSRFRSSENYRRVSATERVRGRLFIPRNHRSHALKNGKRDLCANRPARVLVSDVSIHLRIYQLSLRSYLLCGEACFGALRDGSLPACLSDKPSPDGSPSALISGVRLGRAKPVAYSLLILLADRHP